MKRVRTHGSRKHSTEPSLRPYGEQEVDSELRARRSSEETNRQLRARLKALERLREKVSRTIAKYQRQELECGALRGATSGSKAPTVLSRQVPFNDVSSMLDAMIGEADVAFASTPLHPLDALSSSSLTSTMSSDRCEIRSAVSASCSVATASSLLWEKGPEILTSPLVNHIALGDNGYRQERTLMLCCRQSTELLYLQVFGRRVVDPTTGRVVLAVFRLTRIPAVSSNVVLWEKYWSSVAPSIELGGTGSISHGCYHMQGGGMTNSEASALQARVKHSLVQWMRLCTSTLQDWLLHGGPVASAA